MVTVLISNIDRELTLFKKYHKIKEPKENQEKSEEEKKKEEEEQKI
jgi:hypothetical protein